jgi:UDP-N-acetylmuramyl tripeptide synthase
MLIIAGKLLGKRGSATPGKFALRIAPDILRHLAAQVRQGIIAVCGTNGKTTTNNFIYTLLRAGGYTLVCNRVGANMLYGAVTAFADAAGYGGRLNADFACIEVDELSAVKVFAHFTPNIIVITNLFRDQLDRYGEIDITIESLKRAAAQAGKATLLLNADDPMLAAFGREVRAQGHANIKYFGLRDAPLGQSEPYPQGTSPCSQRGVQPPCCTSIETREGRFCRLCGAELKYDAYYYSQLGRYACPRCGFTRPEPDYTAENITLDGGIAFDLDGTHIAADYRGLYNIYNMLAACAVLWEYDIRAVDINKAFAGYRPQIGRMETFTIGGKQVILNLSKNPAGFNQAIAALRTDTRSKTVVIVINDNDQDGRDVSWLWDVDFERLDNIPDIITSGLRAADMRVRMKYAGNMARILPEIKEAIRAALLCDSDVVYTLVNYTALFYTHDLLEKLSKRRTRFIWK